MKLKKVNSMLKKILCALSISLLATASAFGGIRSPGEYAGIVVYDRWDTCYLYDGIYLMYISEKIKERLRNYAGHTIRIDATEVYQPMNPGDGLIREFNFLGLAKDQGHSQIADLAITIIPHFEIDGSPQFIIDVKNTGQRKITISNDGLAPTLFGEKDADDFLSPSDGKSEARITRWSFPFASGVQSRSIGTTAKWWGVKIDDGKVPSSTFMLAAGKSKQFRASISASPGNYEFLCGYATGQEGNEERISNSVLFNVDEKGKAVLLSELGQGSFTQASSQLNPQHAVQNIINTQPHNKPFSWVALARATMVFALALLIFLRLYRR
jgi:hypothetical protein